ncbi:MAG: hypothetical protein ABI123_08415 [Ginsengibacter sp.]|jgi:hypothetical protein
MRTKLLLSSFFLITQLTGFCQSPHNVSSEAKVNEFYNTKLQSSSSLYSGPQYIEQSYPKTGSPFFLNDTLASGWIGYDNHLYTNVFLQWDVFQNYVLIRSLKEGAKLILQEELIDSFYFSGHLIKKMKADKEHNLLSAGLYDVLYDGKTDVIAMRKKTSMGIIDGKSMVYNFTSKDIIYIKKEGLYNPVKNKKNVLKLFSNNRSAIKRLVRKAGLNWRKNFDQCAAIAAQHYDNSTH